MFVPAEAFAPLTPTVAEGFEANASSWSRVSRLEQAKSDLGRGKRVVARLAWDIVDEWGDQSFPASDHSRTGDLDTMGPHSLAPFPSSPRVVTASCA